MIRTYNGCDSAATATTKIEFVPAPGVKIKPCTMYFGDCSNAINQLNVTKRDAEKDGVKFDFTYDVYIKEINFNTGAMSRKWTRVESGKRNLVLWSI